MTIITQYDSIALQQPSEDQLSDYRKEFQMTPESIKNDIESLKEWLTRNPHLPHVIDDARLERILFYCKNSLEKSKREIEKHYTLRSQYPEFFAARDPSLSKLVKVEKIATYVPLPKLTKSGQRVVMFKIYATPENYNLFDAEAFCTRTFMTYDFRLSHDIARSDILVYDLSDISMAVLGVMPLQMIKKLMSIGANAFPFRLNSFVLYNPPKVLENVINIIKSFVPKKLTNRVCRALYFVTEPIENLIAQ
uniref:Alpha-tocopherol transfer protein-like n=2 Tax=Cacopsylla melanoneura TaxID=428564 RepID=A0A8D9FD64_9HEMI